MGKRIYFVCSYKKTEKEALKNVKPDNILVSYHYFKSVKLEKFIKELGYKPNIFLDSGAFSAFTKGKNVSIIDYMNYIEENKDYIDHYMMLDVMNDADISIKYYEIMKMKGLNPVPVYHYGDDERYLQYYIDNGEKFIALGKTVPIKKKTLVVEWINELMDKYKGIDFHLLGSSSKIITTNTNIHSMDASSWIRRASIGHPRHIIGEGNEARILRAEYQLRKIMERNES